MQTRIGDMRTVRTMAEAREVFDNLATMNLNLEKANAAFEAKVARMKREHLERTAAQILGVDDLEKQLLAFIEANKGLFRDPRKVKTEFGSFGLQKATDVVVVDETALLAEMAEKGGDFKDCLQVTIKPVKKAIAAHIEAGASFINCSIRTGDTAVYSVKKALVDQVRGEAENA